MDQRVLDAMLPYFREHFGNPSSGHGQGRAAREALERARQKVASLLGADVSEIIFTSGGSESNNTVIQGVANAFKGKRRHVVTAQCEHPSVLEPCRALEADGVEVTYLPVDSHCLVDPQEVRKALKPHTILITIMHANNEVGTIQPISEIGRIAREAGVLFHTDAAQSVGMIPLDVREMGVDFVTIAGHKLYAPKGVGALFMREGVVLPPLIMGASQERGRRAGTQSVPLVVALGEACELASMLLPEEMNRIKGLRDELQKRLEQVAPGLALNGHPEQRLPNTLNVSFKGVSGAVLLRELNDICASVGSACHDGSGEISPVLRAMGLTEQRAMGAVRFSLGRWTTQEDVTLTVEAVKHWVSRRNKGIKGWISRLWRRS